MRVTTTTSTILGIRLEPLSSFVPGGAILVQRHTPVRRASKPAREDYAPIFGLLARCGRCVLSFVPALVSLCSPPANEPRPRTPSRAQLAHPQNANFGYARKESRRLARRFFPAFGSLSLVTDHRALSSDWRSLGKHLLVLLLVLLLLATSPPQSLQ